MNMTTITPTIYQIPERNFLLQTSKGWFHAGADFQDRGRIMQIAFISDIYVASDGRRYVNVHAVQIGETPSRNRKGKRDAQKEKRSQEAKVSEANLQRLG